MKLTDLPVTFEDQPGNIQDHFNGSERSFSDISDPSSHILSPFNDIKRFSNGFLSSSSDMLSLLHGI